MLPRLMRTQSLRRVSESPERTVPVMEPMPPMTTKTTKSTLRRKSKFVGLRYWKKGA